MPRRPRVVEAETAEASGAGSIRADETTESFDRVKARERMDINEVVEEEAVATLEAERRARLEARVVGPEEEEGAAEVFASARFRLRVSIQKLSGQINPIAD